MVRAYEPLQWHGVAFPSTAQHLGDFQKRPSQAIPPPSGGEARWGAVAPAVGHWHAVHALVSPSNLPPLGGGQEQSPDTKDTEVGCSFAEIALAPYPARRLHHEFQFPPLLVPRQQVARSGRGEPALRAQRQVFNRHVARCLV